MPSGVKCLSVVSSQMSSLKYSIFVVTCIKPNVINLINFVEIYTCTPHSVYNRTSNSWQAVARQVLWLSRKN